MSKPTLVVGASPHPYRYAHLAVQRLNSHGHFVIAFGKRSGQIGETDIITDPDSIDGTNIDTVTLYLNPGHQAQYADWLLKIAPKRVIFNPGTENFPLESRLRENGIEVLRACTLVMLSTGAY